MEIYRFFALFYFVFEGNFQVQPPGNLYLEGRLNGWFFAFSSLGGLQMEGLIFGILRYLAQILGQYFTEPYTGPGFCRPFFVRWTGVDFGTWDVPYVPWDVTWDVTNETPKDVRGEAKVMNNWSVSRKFNSKHLFCKTLLFRFIFVHYSVMQNNISKEDFIWQAQLVKCSFSLSVFSPHLGPEKKMRTTSQTTKICGFLAMGH